MLGNNEFAAAIGKSILECLPDMNKLKPKMWAQHKERKECFGVSLGVRSYVRSLFLYTKLSQLRKIEREYRGVRLQDVDAFRHMDIMIPDERSEYAVPAQPCLSCRIFFHPDKRTNPERTRFQGGSCPPFGNCAEYDVIRTENLDYCLAFPDVKALWDDVESACNMQFKAFKDLARKLDGPGRPPRRPPRNAMLQTYHTAMLRTYHTAMLRTYHTAMLRKYHTTTRKAETKVLRYKWDSSRREHKLIADVWPR